MPCPWVVVTSAMSIWSTWLGQVIRVVVDVMLGDLHLDIARFGVVDHAGPHLTTATNPGSDRLTDSPTPPPTDGSGQGRFLAPEFLAPATVNGGVTSIISSTMAKRA